MTLNGTLPGEKKQEPDVAGKVERFMNNMQFRTISLWN
jgi:hypothetical protein